MKPLCETRWVERHTAFEDLQDLYEPLATTLEFIALKEERRWNSKSISEATGLLAQLSDAMFTAAFQTCRYLFGFTKCLATFLQGSTMTFLN